MNAGTPGPTMRSARGCYLCGWYVTHVSGLCSAKTPSSFEVDRYNGLPQTIRVSAVHPAQSILYFYGAGPLGNIDSLAERTRASYRIWGGFPYAEYASLCQPHCSTQSNKQVRGPDLLVRFRHPGALRSIV